MVTVKSLKDYKGSLYSALSRDLSEFEKNFLLVTAGTLAFSITFLKDILKSNSSGYVIWLFIAWVQIAASIGIMMFTFLSSAYASNKLLTEVDDFLVSINKFEDTDTLDASQFQTIKTKINTILNDSKNSLRALRFTAIFLFLSGLFSLGIFIWLNMKEVKDSPENTITIYNKEKLKVLKLNGAVYHITDSTITIEK